MSANFASASSSVVSFPTRPQNVPAQLTAPTAAYKRQVWVAVCGLLAFVTVYAGLTFFIVRSAYLAFTNLGGDSTLKNLVVGVFGSVLAVFLVKALFSVKKGSLTQDHELRREDEPQLFRFLDRLAAETGAPRAHRVFVSPRVNAAVFYDISLASFFVAGKKNLEIGLPLVNALTLSEFTAVLAHEFGHFGQKSMAVGRWVYIARQVAAHLIGTRDWLDSFLRGLSRTDIRIAWAGWALRFLVWSIRSILDLAFRVVVLAERALGREMEFQADLVAVSVTGSEALIHALAKLGAADEAWDEALSVAASEASKGRRVPDLFTMQLHVIERTRVLLADPEYGRPKAPSGARPAHRVFSEELAEPPKMWSTHPTNRDREENAKRTFVDAPLDERDAWVLFAQPEKLRAEATSRLLASGFEEARQELTPSEALAAVDRIYERTALHSRYRGCYLGRSVVLAAKDPAGLVTSFWPAPLAAPARLDEAYPEAFRALLGELRASQREKEALRAIHLGNAEAAGGVIRYNGKTLRRRALPSVLEELDAKIAGQRARLAEMDKACRDVHLAAAASIGNGWPEYLAGLLQLAHYAGHQAANVDDAYGHYTNVLHIVTADGNVSGSELKRLVKAGIELQHAIAQVYELRDKVLMPDVVKAAWDNQEWKELLDDELGLPMPTNENMSTWVQHAGGWAEATRGICGALERRVTDALLEAEHRVAEAVRSGTPLEEAPSAGKSPKKYPTLLAGEERPIQRKLDLWDRFQLADGWLAGTARLAVAGGILAFALGNAHSDARVTVFNGTGQPVVIELGEQKLTVGNGQSGEVEVFGSSELPVVARTAGGVELERFDADVSRTALHYVYNVRRAAALVEWDAAYGSSHPGPNRVIGQERWVVTDAQYVFTEPPDQIQMKGSGEVRKALSAVPPESLKEDEEPAAEGATEPSITGSEPR
ncbi:MAG TPA: M48 family metallopeptidase [Polyangiaceae bacterium]|nr:M48 family metallopeptidase [Polyangiaceae bacterium]